MVKLFEPLVGGRATSCTPPAGHRLYEAAGFERGAEEPRHAFGKDLVEQHWNLEL